MSESARSQKPPLWRRIPTPVLIFLVLITLGTAFSIYVFVDRILPIQQQLRALSLSADAFRAKAPGEIRASIDANISWDEILNGQSYDRVVALRGYTGLKYQVVEGGEGGTVFLFPEDTDSVAVGHRVLVYFVEETPPEPGSLVEGVFWVADHDPKASVALISPEQADVLDTSIPRAILFAAFPMNLLAPPRLDLLPEAAREAIEREQAAEAERAAAELLAAEPNAENKAEVKPASPAVQTPAR